jgi:hypothetical protein
MTWVFLFFNQFVVRQADAKSRYIYQVFSSYTLGNNFLSDLNDAIDQNQFNFIGFSIDIQSIDCMRSIWTAHVAI